MRGGALPANEARRQAAVAALASALACRCRGEPVRAIEALASVVLNRLRAARSRRAPAAWGLDLPAALAAAGLSPSADAAKDAPEPLMAACRRIAARAVAGTLPDPTGGAISWHEAGASPPEDAPPGETVRFGRFVFIRPDEAEPLRPAAV